jgi:hypothetical protein
MDLLEFFNGDGDIYLPIVHTYYIFFGLKLNY